MSQKNEGLTDAEGVSFVDSLLGGEESHSPETDKEIVPGNAPDSDAGRNAPEAFGEDEEGFASEEAADSAKEKESELKPVEIPVTEDAARLKQEVETLNKRLHDTQKAMHEATGERARLAKELEELKARRADDDNWFSDEDKDRLERLESEVSASEEKIGEIRNQSEELRQKQAEAIWDEAAKPVMAKHPDFEEVVYGTLAPMLDPQSGDAPIRAMWEKEKDKSPSNAYAFAKKVIELQKMQSDPEAYKEQIRREAEEELKQKTEQRGGSAPIGKAGLDLYPSAVGAPVSGDDTGGSFVDTVFK